ncbi:hypothetical protein MVEN_00043200 [Mycena venus]|uniref:Uncharacterized protein n=1 Tax=Mycena venus TaxID=2733690 RepID=A0A8H7DG40_9AGAR|nr:hypothetical protein MVEN_00043200 [Mycena venus]
MFDAATGMTQREIKVYRGFLSVLSTLPNNFQYCPQAFPSVLGNPGHDPFFSIEDATRWVTSRGYQLYLEQDDTRMAISSWDPDEATPAQIRAYRTYMVSEDYLGHPFFSLDNSDSWINPVAFQQYMETFHGSFDEYRTRNSTPFSSRAPSRAASSVRSRAPSRADSSLSVPDSRPASCASFIPSSGVPSSRCSSPVSFENDVIEISDDEDEFPATVPPRLVAPKVERTSTPPLVAAPSTRKRKGETESGVAGDSINSELQDQDSWGGSSGHLKGDGKAFGLMPDVTEAIECRRCHSKLSAIRARRRGYARKLQMDASECEAASEPAKIARFYMEIMNSKCKVECDGVPFIKEFLNGTTYAKRPFIGCPKWNPAERFQHHYLPIPDNIDIETLRFIMRSDGRLPDSTLNLNGTCPLTVHPRMGKGLKHCPYSHIVNGQIKAARLVQRKCTTEMIIFVPIDRSSPVAQNALVVLRNPRNHPTHPKTKPSTDDRRTLAKAIEANGVVGLTAQRLLNAPSTSLIYKGERVAAVSPEYMDNRRVRDFIDEQKKKDYPRGMGWDVHPHGHGKNNFRLVVTMHPQIASYIHHTLALNIDFTFKRVEGKMNEWEVAGMSDRFNQRLTFANLFCDSASTEAFTQLFIELFHTVAQVTGTHLKLSPFFPDANCRIVMLDGELPQALGFGHFLVIYKNPTISGIHSRDPIELLSHCLKTCWLHFERHIDELPRDIPREVIQRLKSIASLKTKAEIDDWDGFCASQTHIGVKIKKSHCLLGDLTQHLEDWYAHKLANPWILHSINKYLSKISDANWNITPNHSNLVETAHAGRNAETSIGVGLLTAILQSQARDNAKAETLLQIEHDGVARGRWDTIGDRGRLSMRRKVWRMRKAAIRSDQLTSHDSLKADLAAGAEENKASIERQKGFEADIKSLQELMGLDKHRSDLKEQVLVLRREIEEEKAGRREWVLRKAEINSQLTKLRAGPLAGARINGRRPAERPGGNDLETLSSGLIEEVTTSTGEVGIEKNRIVDSHKPGTTLGIGTDMIDSSNVNLPDFAEFHVPSPDFPDMPQRSDNSIWDPPSDTPPILE